MGVVSHFYLKGSGARRKVERARKEKMEGGKKNKRKGDWRMDAQVLLLRDPGAELGWAELSERLPSGGGERKQDKCHQYNLLSLVEDSRRMRTLMKSWQCISKSSVSLLHFNDISSLWDLFLSSEKWNITYTAMFIIITLPNHRCEMLRISSSICVFSIKNIFLIFLFQISKTNSHIVSFDLTATLCSPPFYGE